MAIRDAVLNTPHASGPISSGLVGEELNGSPFTTSMSGSRSGSQGRTRFNYVWIGQVTVLLVV
jgi:hypothetical protein